MQKNESGSKYQIWTKYLGLKCLIGGTLLLILSLFLHYDNAPKWVIFLSKLLEHVGVALVIAVFVGWTIDSVHKKEFNENSTKMLEEFKRNAFTSVYNWAIPRTFLDAIQEQIFTCKLIRNNWDVMYTLRPFTNDETQRLKQAFHEYPLERRLAVDIVIEGIIKNVSTSVVVKPLVFFLEKEDAPEFNRCTAIEIFEVGGDFSKKYDEQDLLKLQVKQTDDDDDATKNTLSINNNFTTESISFLPGKTYRILMHATYSRSKNYAREVMTIMSLTQSVKVTVVSQFPELCIYGELLSPYGFKTSHNGNRYTFTSDNPNLPHQGYMIWWHSGISEKAMVCPPSAK